MTLPSQAELIYTIDHQGGSSLAQLATAIAEPPVPQDLVEAIGARLFSDATTSASPTVTRTVTLKLRADTPAHFLPVFTGDGSELLSCTLHATGSGYVQPPRATITGGSALRQAVLQAYMNFQGTTIVNGGTLYTAPSLFLLGGLAIPQLDVQGLILPLNGNDVTGCVQDLTLVSGGRGYSANTVVQFNAPLAPGGVMPTAAIARDSNGVITSILLTSSGSGLLGAAQVFVEDPGPSGNGSGGGKGAVVTPQMGIGTAGTATLGLTGGAITSVTAVNHGGPYVKMPRNVVTDTTGSGALLVPLMGVSQIDVISGGSGYGPAGSYSVTLTEIFIALFGNTPDTPFFNLMRPAIEQFVGSPLTSAGIVIT